MAAEALTEEPPMTTTTPPLSPITHLHDAEEHHHSDPDVPGYAQSYRVLTPFMEARGGRLGVNVTRVPPGHVACPFHHHAREDEAFFILEGTGVLRYGEDLYPLRPGDCVSCPANTQIAHQIANTGQVDLVYLAMGNNDPFEVCVYPDSGKVLVRALKTVGHLQRAPYMDAEPLPPRLLAMAAALDESK